MDSISSSLSSEAKDPPDPSPLSVPPDLLAVVNREDFSSSHIASLPQAQPVVVPILDSSPVIDSSVTLTKLVIATSESPGLIADSGAPDSATVLSTKIVAPSVVAPVLWASKFTSSLRNLKKVSLPSTLEDGTLSVAAPDSVILQSYDIWRDHLVAKFHGMPPSVAKVFSDLNPIWGSQGRISIKQYSPRTMLIYIPSEVTRKWVLDVAFWQAGNCSFSVSKWSSLVNVEPKPLIEAPVWVVLRNVPPPLFTFEGLSVIGSAIGDPLYTEKPILVMNPLGMVKIKVIIQLGKPAPSSVRVVDKLGNSVIVGAEYLRVPPLCDSCGEFGHLSLRCPCPSVRAPLSKKGPLAPVKLSRKKNTAVVFPLKQSIKPSSFRLGKKIVKSKSASSLVESILEGAPASRPKIDLGGWTVVNRREKGLVNNDTPLLMGSQFKTTSVPTSPSSRFSDVDKAKPLGNLESVIARSKHVPLEITDPSPFSPEESLTSSKVQEEEEGIKASQSRLRLLSKLQDVDNSKTMSAKRKKKERQKLRKALFDHEQLEVCSSDALVVSSESSDSQGHSPERVVSPVEA
ncbi:hypothetical protein AALP_AA4G232900 [Arabis alpina]|uniref:CCHC-type domain-containing protein n=1 Tax=Arabis alpina TaxID=50452 RepID=A0A087H544_ARAAL|nr:hypothetical protein AALP_AA4G232900 [Arabis alpina]